MRCVAIPAGRCKGGPPAHPPFSKDRIQAAGAVAGAEAEAHAHAARARARARASVRAAHVRVWVWVCGIPAVLVSRLMRRLEAAVLVRQLTRLSGATAERRERGAETGAILYSYTSTIPSRARRLTSCAVQ